MSQVELAEVMGVDQQRVSWYEKGNSPLDQEWIELFGRGLGCSPMAVIADECLLCSSSMRKARTHRSWD